MLFIANDNNAPFIENIKNISLDGFYVCKNKGSILAYGKRKTLRISSNIATYAKFSRKISTNLQQVTVGRKDNFAHKETPFAFIICVTIKPRKS